MPSISTWKIATLTTLLLTAPFVVKELSDVKKFRSYMDLRVMADDRHNPGSPITAAQAQRSDCRQMVDTHRSGELKNSDFRSSSKDELNANLPTTSRKDHILNVCHAGCTYQSVHDAFYAALDMAYRAADPRTTFTVQIADGTYDEAWQLLSSNTEGSQIRILGNLADESRVTVNFTNISGNNLGGIVATDGGRIGYVDGVTLNATGTILSKTYKGIRWVDNSHGAGIAAQNNGVIHIGPHVTVTRFYYGLVADHGGFMVADGAKVLNSGDVGIFAKFGGILQCRGCSSSYTSDIYNKLGSNYMAEQGGHLDIDRASGDQALYAGVAAISGGTIWANDFRGGSMSAGSFGNETSWGVWAVNGGNIQIEHALIQRYSDGVRAQSGGSIDLNGSSLSFNTNSGINSEGGIVRGFGVRINNNGEYGLKATNNANIELYDSYKNMHHNAAGNIFQGKEHNENGAHTSGPSIILN